jgi:hypothetical protein
MVGGGGGRGGAVGQRSLHAAAQRHPAAAPAAPYTGIGRDPVGEEKIFLLIFYFSRFKAMLRIQTKK